MLPYSQSAKGPLTLGCHPHAGGRGTGTQVQGALEGCTAAALTVCMPALLYLASHISMLEHWVHFWSLLLLGSGPLLFLTVLPVSWGTWSNQCWAVSELQRLTL